MIPSDRIRSMGLRMFGFSREGAKASLLMTTLKSVLAIGGISLVAANWVSTRVDQPGLAKVAQDVSRGLDPITTGSIGAKANATRLDPCTGKSR